MSHHFSSTHDSNHVFCCFAIIRLQKLPWTSDCTLLYFSEQISTLLLGLNKTLLHSTGLMLVQVFQLILQVYQLLKQR